MTLDDGRLRIADMANEFRSEEQLRRGLEKAKKKVVVGGKYAHYKHPDRYYVVEFVGFLENSEEVCVGYRSLYGKGILWVRTLADFTAEVDLPAQAGVDGKRVKRFSLA